MRLGYIVLVLLLIPLFAMSAGAIYIEGQAPPVDDGEAYILAAASGAESAPVPTLYDDGPIKRYLSDDPNDYVLVPGNDPDMMYALGEDVSEVQPIFALTPAVTPMPGMNGMVPVVFSIPTMKEPPQLAGGLPSIPGKVDFSKIGIGMPVLGMHGIFA